MAMKSVPPLLMFTFLTVKGVTVKGVRVKLIYEENIEWISLCLFVG
jgi:hypothetical protein